MPRRKRTEPTSECFWMARSDRRFSPAGVRVRSRARCSTTGRQPRGSCLLLAEELSITGSTARSCLEPVGRERRWSAPEERMRIRSGASHPHRSPSRSDRMNRSGGAPMPRTSRHCYLVSYLSSLANRMAFRGRRRPFPRFRVTNTRARRFVMPVSKGAWTRAPDYFSISPQLRGQTSHPHRTRR